MSKRKQSLSYHSHFYEKEVSGLSSGDLSRSIPYFLAPGA